ncbi:putative UDP-rhamnose:rhamnosyltransferase 1 [Rhododendron vialii]|uniref:putative UDP-rhamnose:rhamnosyltransferase 1 n=1 Tax=Rhododendron vialii TaxID=182163 RepID=UPI00265EE6FF|nr:putative UDP-rhamnose:rhamnosyltransferase 1 [Rhododendron vialii]
MAGDGKKLHVAMFPWLAFGHMIPFLDLAKFIAQKGHKISYLSTPRNLTRLPKLPPHLNSLITFVPISLPRVDQLPENAEATMDVHPDDVHYLKKAFDGLETELARFLETESPDWIIYDFAPHWLPPIAGKLGISRAFFSIINAWFLAFFGPSAAMLDNSVLQLTDPEQFLVPPKWITFPTKAAYRAYEIKRTFKTGSEPQNASGIEDFYRVGCIITGCDALAIRHCREFEPNWLTLLEELHGKPIIPLGLMPPLVEESSSDDSKNDTWVSISEWLNKQTIGYVVYVALGSEVALSPDELTELALGLELSRLPFFWVLRKPSGSTEADSFMLPDGFEERTKHRGIVWKNWAPQLRILNHDSVGGFLTHCGWSSIVEGVRFGLPLIMLPLVLDQGLNARLMEEHKVGIEVPRDEADGLFTRNSVAESITLVMVAKEKGSIYRERAKEMSSLFSDKLLHDQYLDNFVQYLENHRG